jgi:hypothetical protein
VRLPGADYFVRVAAGSDRALFVTGPRPFAHPERASRLSGAVAALKEEPVLCLGDVVEANGSNRMLSGRWADGFLVGSPSGRELAKEVKFVDRPGGSVTRESVRDVIYDNGRLLEGWFGVSAGQYIEFDGEREKVLGVYDGWLGIRDTLPIGIRCSIPEYFARAVVLNKDSEPVNVVCVGGVNYPVKPVAPFWIAGDPPAQVIGEFGAFCVGTALLGWDPYEFYARDRAFRLTAAEQYTVQDRVRFESDEGTLVAIRGDTALFLSDDARDRGATPVAVPLNALAPIATLVAGQTVEVGGDDYEVQFALGTIDCLPGDLLFSETEALTVIGFKDEHTFALDSGGEVREVTEEYHLLQRRASLGAATALLCDGDDRVIVSLRLDRFVGTGVRPGDEVAVDGEYATLAGIADGYFWFVRRGGRLYCASLEDWYADTERSIVSR